jgi:hypothetical protein
MAEDINIRFQIELLPALHGDCVWIEYGPSESPKRILIDGGPIGAYGALQARADKLPFGDREIELIMITHVDADHIEGAIRLIAEWASKLSFREVWFNGWRHLEEIPGMLGAVQGEFVSALIEKFIGSKRWNSSNPFNGGPLVVAKEGAPPSTSLNGGMRLTLLSPTPEKLEKLRKSWKNDVNKKGISPGDLDAALNLLRTQHRLVPDGLLGGSYQLGEARIPLDNAVANGSSLAMLAEFGGKRCLLLGDAHPDAIINSLKKLGASMDHPMHIDTVKVSHHGSKGNTTPELLELISCKRFFISTSGAVFNHPDQEAIDMIISKAGPGVELVFNYLSDTTRPWSDSRCQQARHYHAVYPQSEGASVVLDLIRNQTFSPSPE